MRTRGIFHSYRRATLVLLATLAVGAACSSSESESQDTARAESAVTVNGLLGNYYDQGDFTDLKVTRVDAKVNFDWTSGAPDSRLQADTFSVRWTGKVLAPSSGTYTFSVTSDDGARLWVNGVQLVDDWGPHTLTTSSGQISLVAGQRYDIRLDYRDNSGAAAIDLSWRRPGVTSFATIPSSNLFTEAPGADAGADGSTPPVCVPSCSGKQCGSDGCGGTCGTCSATQTCSASGSCVAGGGTPPWVSNEFHMVQEYFHDGGGLATEELADLEFDSASFKGGLTTSERSFIAAHHPFFAYFTLPTNLVQSSAAVPYPQAADPSYVQTMLGLVSSYGITNNYLFAMPEWDNDPANTGWARNRFSEAGVGGSRPDIPSGLTRQQAYDQYRHFYLANNHNGNTSHHQLGQILSVPYQTRGYKVQANCANAGSGFYAYEMGVDLVTLQRVNDDISGLIGGIGMLRGAATQYGRPWGIDISSWRTAWGAGVTGYNSAGSLTGGWSASLFRRTYYLSYMSGPLTIFQEAHDYRTNGKTNINGRYYTPQGTEIRDFDDFAFNRHPQRGIPHVPVALMKDHVSFFEPRFGRWMQGRSVWYSTMDPNGGENMLHNLFDTIYPGYNLWGSTTDTTEPMGSGRWGEQFDVVTERIGQSALGSYRAIILSTDAVVDATLQAKLTAFAQAGGVVVVNARQLAGTAHEALTGIKLTGTASGSGPITWDADGTTTSEAAYNYSTVTLGTASVLAHSGTSTPQVTRNVVGNGEVWVTLPAYMSNSANNATLGVGAKVIDSLIKRFAVATVQGNSVPLDYAVNRKTGTTGNGTAVTLINNSTSGQTWTGTVSFAASAGTVTDWVNDTPVACSPSAGRMVCNVTVAPGASRVLNLQ